MANLPVRILWLQLGAAEVGLPASGIEEISVLTADNTRSTYCLAGRLGLARRSDLLPRVLWTSSEIGIEVSAEMSMVEHESEDLLPLPTYLDAAWADVGVDCLARRGDGLALVLKVKGSVSRAAADGVSGGAGLEP